MKTFLATIAFALIIPFAHAVDESCPRGCYEPRPAPREYQCKIEMVDCNNQSLYIYTGTAESHKAACQAATRVCLNDVRLGYGGYGAKCWMIGK